jgi:UDP-4-amino-4-deoxy-L-arabinose formyltransferase/UDP-glucuronic acid dehydrogenase (UDP-4-keto-hexauronic acid decarboxylating)
MKIVLVAQEAAGVRALRLVLGSPHHLHAVLSDPDGATSIGRSVAGVARENGIPLLPAATVKNPDFADELARAEVDVLLNVHSLHVIPHDVLAAPRFGCFNLHPGPLPEYAGMNVPSWAIYRGERTHAVTLHWMSPAIDAGSTAYSTTFPISPRDTGLTVSATCARLGVALVARLLDDLSTNPAAIRATPQDLANRRYYGRSVPNDGWIGWTDPARRVVDFVRACDYGPFESPWGGARLCTPAGSVLTTGRAKATAERTAGTAPGTVGRCDADELWVAASDVWLVLRDLRTAPGAAPVAPCDVLSRGDVLGRAGGRAAHAPGLVSEVVS